MIEFPPFHERLLGVIHGLSESLRLALAGGYSVKAHGLVDRPSQDLDFATDSFQPLGEILRIVADACRRAGFDVHELEGTPRLARLIVTEPVTAQACEIDLLKEALQREPVTICELRVVHFDDAVGLKLRALHERSVARDYIDAAAIGAVLPFAEMERLATLHTENFSTRELVGRLEGVEFIDLDEFARYGLDEDAVRDIRRFALTWATEIKRRRAADGDAASDFESEISAALYEG